MPPITPALIAIPTRHRPHDVLGLLQSLDAAADPSSSPVDVLVVDDSDDDHAAETYAVAATSFARLRVEYVSFRERQAWTLSIAAASGLDADLCLSLLAPATRIATNVGAARNYALLRARGRSVLFLDDDVRAGIAATGDSAATRFTGLEEPLETQCFERFVDAAVTLTCVPTDLRALHATALGAETETADGPRTTRLVMLGYAGRSGLGSPAFYLLTRGSVRQQIIKHIHAYELILAINLVLRGAPCVTHASPAALTMGGCLSVDCSVAVPPFLPSGRNQDGFFGALFALVHPQALMTHLPFAVQHGVAQSYAGMRPSNRAEVRALASDGAQFASVFLSLLPALQLAESDLPEQRMSAIGAYFMAFDGIADALFEHNLRTAWAARRANWAGAFEAAAARLPAGLSAHDDALRLAADFRAQAQAAQLPEAEDAPAANLRAALVLTGRQLQAWSQLWGGL